MEYEYVTASGEKKRAKDSKRLTFMGRREFFFTDLKEEEKTGSFQDQNTYSPLLSAWVTLADMPVAGLASLANKRAGGVAAGASDKECLEAMEQCYEIMRDIKITYQHPANMVDASKQYEPLEVQSLQYPRDTIESAAERASTWRSSTRRCSTRSGSRAIWCASTGTASRSPYPPPAGWCRSRPRALGAARARATILRPR